MKRLTGMAWLKKQITKLEVTNSSFKEEAIVIRKIKPKIYNEFRAWTPLKLILLNYALDVCTTIIKNTKFFKRIYYADLFAGSGINKVKGEEDFLIGSPFIASLNYSDTYNSMIFCENNPAYIEALELRLKELNKKNLIIMKEGYETCLDTILKKVGEKQTYSFFFIDPHCMEFVWDSMKKVLEVRSDIIFTFMSSEINRVVGLVNAGKSEGKGLTKFFGDESWKNAKNVEELVQIYKQNIIQERIGAPVRTIKIKSGQFNFCYHLFFITNKTTGENKWLKAIDKAKKEIESNSDVAVKKALDIIKKRQHELS